MEEVVVSRETMNKLRSAAALVEKRIMPVVSAAVAAVMIAVPTGSTQVSQLEWSSAMNKTETFMCAPLHQESISVDLTYPVTILSTVTTLFLLKKHYDDQQEAKDVEEFRYLNAIPENELSVVASFLDIPTLCNLSCTNKRLEKILKSGSHYWNRKPILAAEYYHVPDPPPKARVLMEYCHYYRTEHSYFSKHADLVVAQARNKEWTDLAVDTCWFPSLEISSAVAKHTKGRLSKVVLVKTPEEARMFRKRARYCGGALFVALNMPHTTQTLDCYKKPKITAPGFIGYAIDLLQIKPGKEHLKEGLFTLIRNLTIWETDQDIQHAKDTNQFPNVGAVSLESSRNWHVEVSIPQFKFLNETRPDYFQSRAEIAHYTATLKTKILHLEFLLSQYQ